MSSAPDDENELGDFRGLESIKDQPMGMGHMIATIALNMALKYHDISTVQDGALYQQFKLEGKNMIPLDLHMVFETAKQMEVHLATAPDRLASVVIDALQTALDEDRFEVVAEDAAAPDGEK